MEWNVCTQVLKSTCLPKETRNQQWVPGQSARAQCQKFDHANHRRQNKGISFSIDMSGLVHSFCWLHSNGFWRFATHPGAARGNPKGPENPDVTTAIWLRQRLLNITPKRQRFTMYTAMHNFVPLTWSIQSGKYSGQIKAWHLKMGWDETQTRTISNSLVSNEQLGIIYIWMDASFPTTLKSSHLLQ